MLRVQCFAKMKIGTAHRNKLWKALLDWRKTVNTIDLSQIQPSLTAASDLSSQQSGFNPGYYEITRYTFKQVISFEKTTEKGSAAPTVNGGEAKEKDMGESPSSTHNLRKRKSDCLDE